MPGTDQTVTDKHSKFSTVAQGLFKTVCRLERPALSSTSAGCEHAVLTNLLIPPPQTPQCHAASLPAEFAKGLVSSSPCSATAASQASLEPTTQIPPFSATLF